MDTDWPAIAHQAHYRVAGLVELYGKERLWVWRLWRRECGCSPKVWLEELRAQAAARLAVAGLKTEEIATSLFYADASHLTHDFRQRFGQPIRRYRAARRGRPDH